MGVGYRNDRPHLNPLRPRRGLNRSRIIENTKRRGRAKVVASVELDQSGALPATSNHGAREANAEGRAVARGAVARQFSVHGVHQFFYDA